MRSLSVCETPVAIIPWLTSLLMMTARVRSRLARRPVLPEVQETLEPVQTILLSISRPPQPRRISILSFHRLRQHRIHSLTGAAFIQTPPSTIDYPKSAQSTTKLGTLAAPSDLKQPKADLAQVKPTQSCNLQSTR
jgi:hypothetical protein